jgi:hypothetical protein
MFGDRPVAGRHPIGTSVTSSTIRIESQAARLTNCRMLSTLTSFMPDQISA